MVPRNRTPRHAAAGALVLKAEDFLSHVESGTFSEKFRGRKVVVRGDIDLRNHPLKSRIVDIPAVAIVGKLVADATCALRTCRCGVSGDVNLDGSLVEEFTPVPELAGSVGGRFSAAGCARLRTISGKFLKDVSLNRSSIPSIGSDFCCQGDLSVGRCRKIRFLDCSARHILADGSSLERFGPNASAEGVSAEGCSKFATLTPIAGLRWAKFDGSGVREVARDFRCDGPVYYKRCRNLVRLSGSSMTVEVSQAPLESVAGLNADEIIFTDCPALPEAMYGLRSSVIVFAGCLMNALPAGVSPKTSLRIGRCKNFSCLPRRWSGDLSISQLPSLESVPGEFRCEGNLDIADCPKLHRLSGFVGGDLQIMQGTPSLRHLADDLQVAGNLKVAADSGVLSLSCGVGGGVSARQSRLAETGKNLRVGEWGDFSGCREIGVVRGVFGGNVDLSGSSVTHLGADFECGGNLVLDNTDRMVSLNCTVAGATVADNSSLQRTGSAFRCGKEFWARRCLNIGSVDGEVRGTVKMDEHVRNKLSRTKKFRISECGEKQTRPLSRPRAGTAVPRVPSRVYPTESFVPGWRGL